MPLPVAVVSVTVLCRRSNAPGGLPRECVRRLRRKGIHERLKHELIQQTFKLGTEIAIELVGC